MKQIFLIFLFFRLAPALALPTDGLTDLDGKGLTFAHSKNTELVVFWATWCPTCKEKLTTFLPKLNAESKVAVVTINTDSDLDRVKHYLKKEKISLPVFVDSQRKLRKELKAFSVPHWAVYKRKDKESPWALVDTAPAFEVNRVEKAIKQVLPNDGPVMGG